MNEQMRQEFELWAMEALASIGVRMNLKKVAAMPSENPYVKSKTWKAYEAWCAGAKRASEASDRIESNTATIAVEHSSRRMFVARLENLTQTSHHHLTVAEVLALLNDCDMLAARE